MVPTCDDGVILLHIQPFVCVRAFQQNLLGVYPGQRKRCKQHVHTHLRHVHRSHISLSIKVGFVYRVPIFVG